MPARKPKEPAVPNMKNADAAANVTRDAYAAGAYELQPQFKRKPEAKNAAPAPEPDLADVAPTPPHLIRMTHPDGATADGVATDETGAILVPVIQVAQYQAHGFVVDHLPQPEAEAA